MVRVILEGNRREVYAMGFDLMNAIDERGELMFGDITESKDESTFREEDPLDCNGSLVFRTEKYTR